MTDNPKMVDLPWHDGTTRTVPEWTVYAADDGALYAARDGGHSVGVDPSKPWHETIYPNIADTAAVRIFTEAPEPPVKVDVPTGIGAIVSHAAFPHSPRFVLTRDGWRGIGSYVEYDQSEVARELSRGAHVLYEGVDEESEEIND